MIEIMKAVSWEVVALLVALCALLVLWRGLSMASRSERARCANDHDERMAELRVNDMKRLPPSRDC